MNALLKQIISLIGGGIGGALGQVITLIQEGFRLTTQFHQEGIAFARDVGLSAKQAQAYTNTLIERTQTLANKYGVSAEAIMQVQRNLSDAAGKQLMLNNAQAEGFVQMNKLVGAQATSKFTEEIMNGMGGQIDTVNAAVAKTYATALKQGLNAKKLTDKVAQNLSMPNRLSFRNGIEGITRMAAMSEKLGFNMQSVESAANNFLELDKAIENAAQMQMLGGSAAVNFGNPLTAAYEANYDPEAFAERMSNSLASYAEFDASKGVANINGMNMDFVRNIAKAMGISAEEASRMAKKQSEVRYKERNFESTFARYGLNDDQRNFLINNGQVKNGQLFYTDAKGKEHNVSNGDIDKKLLDEIRQFEGQSDRQILENQARSLTSINEQLSGTITTFIASIAKGLSFGETLQDIQKDVYDIGEDKDIKNNLEKLGEKIGSFVKGAIKYLSENKDLIVDGIKKVSEAAVAMADVLLWLKDLVVAAKEHWRWLVGALGGYLAYKGFRGGFGSKKGASPSTRTRGTTPNASSNGAKAKKTPSWKQATSRSKNSYRMTKGGALKKSYNATKIFWKNSPKLAKFARGTAGVGTALAVGEGAYAAYNYSKKKDEILKDKTKTEKEKNNAILEAKKERNESFGSAGGALAGGIGGAKLGAIIGTAITPGLGTAIGGFLGGVIGGIGGAFAGEALGGAVSQKPEKHAQGGIVGGNSSEGDKIITGLNSGEMVLNRTQQANLFNLINGLNGINGIITSILENSNDVKAKPVGEKEYIYIPQKNANSLPNETSITVKDINVNIGGTIKLDGGRYSKSVDVNELLNDMVFVSSLKEMIKESINRDMNGGLYNNDLASRRGGGAPLSIIGR